MRFNCCNATRPMLNKAHEAAAKSGNKTTSSLVSAIMFTNIKDFPFEYYYTSFIKLVLKTNRNFFDAFFFIKIIFLSETSIST
jgi:hypothetical protein